MKTGKTTHTCADGLTLAQQNAVDLLAAGKNDTETADALKLHRVTVTRWRCYGLEFRAALAERRATTWGAAADRLRALLPKALDVLAEALENGDDKVAVAVAVLKMAGPLPLVPADPTDAETIVQTAVEGERVEMRAHQRIEALDRMNGMPSRTVHVENVRERLRRQAEADDDVPPC